MGNRGVDIFFCYRRQGAQTAKLFKRFLEKNGYCENIWYSDEENLGNYEQDIKKILDEAKCAVLFLSDNFTRDFELLSVEDNSVIQKKCITALEIIEIERKLQSDSDFRIVTINLDGYILNEEDEKKLEWLFKKAGIFTSESVGHFAYCNQNPFDTARGVEDEFFQKMSVNLLSEQYYREQVSKGNFYFKNVQTTVDVVVWDGKKGLKSEDIEFYRWTEPIRLYDKINRGRVNYVSEGQNNKMVSLVNCHTMLSDNDERKKITIGYKIIDYELFSKCLYLKKTDALNINQEISRYQCTQDVYKIPNAMGMALMVITADNHLIFSRRSQERGIRPGEFDCSIVEGLQLESANGDYTIDSDNYIEWECRRAYEEEICGDSEDISIKIYGIAFDRAYGQWNIIGCVITQKTKEELIKMQPFRDDTSENRVLEFVPICNGDGDIDLTVLEGKIQEYRRVALWDMALLPLRAALEYVSKNKFNWQNEWDKLF